jgi:hypothetical protein
VLTLQRQAGNAAVTQFLQRDKSGAAEEKDPWFFSKVAIANPAVNYKGKTNATFDNVNVERHWEWGLLYDDIAIVFQCGPQRFRFEAARTGDGDFPWGILNARGGTGGWLTDEVGNALRTIYDHWKDEKKFHAATRVVIDALKYDVEKYRDLEADARRRREQR